MENQPIVAEQPVVNQGPAHENEAQNPVHQVEQPVVLVPLQEVVDNISNAVMKAFIVAHVPELITPILSEAVTEVISAAVVTAVPPMLVPAAQDPNNIHVQELRNIGVAALINTEIHAPAGQGPTPPPIRTCKLYWVEVLSILSVFNAGLLSALALSFPGETVQQRKNKALAFTFLTVSFMIFYGGKVAAERVADGAQYWGFWYSSKRDNVKVFYFKVVSQILGILTVLCTFCICIVYLVRSFKEKKSNDESKNAKIDRSSVQFAKFFIGLAAIVFTTINGAFQSFGTRRKSDIVQNNIGNEFTVRRLESAPRFPPDGRVDFVRVNQNFRPHQMRV